MSKQFVYRLEKNGVGPYQFQSAFSYQEKLLKSHNRASHPSWGLDGITRHIFDNSKDNHISGFKSLSDLFNWFGGHLIPLLKAGFTIKSYYISTENIVHGRSNRQLAFKTK